MSFQQILPVRKCKIFNTLADSLIDTLIPIVYLSIDQFINLSLYI